MNQRIAMLFLILIFLPPKVALAAFPGVHFSGIPNNQAQVIRRQIQQALRPTLKIDKALQLDISNISIDNNHDVLILTHSLGFSAWDLHTGAILISHKAPTSDIHKVHFGKSKNDIIALDKNLALKRIYHELEERIVSDIKITQQIVALADLETESHWLSLSTNGNLSKLDLKEHKTLASSQLSGSNFCCLVTTANRAYVANSHQVVEIDIANSLNVIQQWDIDSQIQGLQLSEDKQYLGIIGRSKLQLFSLPEAKPLWERSNSQSLQMLGFQGSHWLGISNQQLKKYSLSNGELTSQDIESFSATPIQGRLYKKTALVIADDGTLFGLDTENAKAMFQLVVTDEGWSMIDNNGRFDGLAAGVKAISWEAAGKGVALANFAKPYYEPGLLKRYLMGLKTPLLTEKSPDIQDGIFLPPDVSLSTQPSDQLYGAATIAVVTAKATKNTRLKDIHEAQVFVNGKRLPENQLIDRSEDADENQVTWRYRLSPTANAMKLVAKVSAWNSITASSPLVEVQATNIAKTTHTSLISIGINEYQSEHIRLNYSVPDAKAVNARFGNILGETQKSKSHTVLLDHSAKATSIRSQLSQLATTSPSDSVILYLSGHGVALDKHWYYLPQEATGLEDPEHVKEIGISGNELAEALIKAPAQNIFLAIDACQSGAVLNDFEVFKQRKQLQQLAEETGVRILTATRADQLAPEFDRLGHGLFTYVLLHGLKYKDGYFNADKWPRDGNLSVDELERHVMRNSPILANFLLEKAQGNKDDRGTPDIPRVIVSPSRLDTSHDFFLN